MMFILFFAKGVHGKKNRGKEELMEVRAGILFCV